VHGYVAGPIFSPHQLKVIKGIESVLTMHKHTFFSPYEESRAIWNGRAPKDCTEAERKRVVQGNINGLHKAEFLIAWVGGQLQESHSADTGTVWEMGYYRCLRDAATRLGVGEPGLCIAYVDPRDLRQNMNLMLAETVDCAVRGMAQLSIAFDMIDHLKHDEMLERYHPSKLILQEREPIG